MNINKKLVSFLLVPTSLLFSAAIILGLVESETVYMPYKVRADREPYKLVLDASKTPFLNGDTSFQNKDKDLGTRNIISFINGKYYAAGLCTLQANEGWIYKKDNERSNALTKFYATGSGTLKIYTSFDGDYEDHGTDDLGYNITPYIYDYVLGTDQEIDIVGNYFKIQAVDNDADIVSIEVDYDCIEEESLFSRVYYSDEDNYISINKSRDPNDEYWMHYLEIKLKSSRNLNASQISLRNTDKSIDKYTRGCESLTKNGDVYTAKFDLTQLNVETGKWTQFTYVPRIYVDNKRVDGTENGNVYVPNRNIDTNPTRNAADDNIYTNAGGDCAYILKNEGWGIVISWINNLSFYHDGNVYKMDDIDTRKGMRFTHLGYNQDGTMDINTDKTWNNGEHNNYYLLEGYVKTLSEAKEVLSKTSYYTLYTTAISSGSNFETTASSNISSYEPWYDGYKINLWFNISEGNGRKYAIGLRYNGLPYILRDDSANIYLNGGAGNSGLLRNTYSVNNSNFNTGWRYPGDNDLYQYKYCITGEWNWIWINSELQQGYRVYWDEDGVYGYGACNVIAWTWGGNYGGGQWIDCIYINDKSCFVPIDSTATGFLLGQFESWVTSSTPPSWGNWSDDNHSGIKTKTDDINPNGTNYTYKANWPW